MKKVLGIDPGYGRLGWAVVASEGNKDILIDAGCFETSAKLPQQERLGLIGNHIQDILKKHDPEAVAIERLFLKHNRKSAINVAEVRGVVLHLSASRSIYEFAPSQVKQNICGYGKADKTQIQKMVMLLLNLKELPKPDDKADAIAIALCGARKAW